ncbi:transposable element Tcb1 transposase [Trichonephila clavipes]|nr:transposable element Tcb1 transposase [Trichonephila clavipes]
MIKYDRTINSSTVAVWLKVFARITQTQPKIDEVEKLAYQLNEEAERTERPIRRLSKVMYGSTCADMQTTSEHGWRCRSRTSVVGELLTASFHDFGDNFKLQEQLSGGSVRPRGNTPADDRYIVLQARRKRRQTAGEIRHTSHVTGRPISRFTVARRLHGGDLFARRPVRCVPLTPAHRRRRSLWCREHRHWRDNEWGRVLFTDESRFSLSSDSHRILIWRERGSRNHPSNIIERGQRRYGSAVPFHGRQCTMSSHSSCRTALRERLAVRTLTPVTIRELRLTLQDEWAAMAQQLIDTLILSAIGRRCETCLAVRGDHIPLLKTGCFLLDTHHRDVSAFSRIALHATFSIKLLFIPLISLLVRVAYITHVLTYWGSYGIKCVDLGSFCTKLY